MKCPRCGHNYCDIIADSRTAGSDYSICQGVCGLLLLGPLGSLCGWTNGRETSVKAYWVCKKCGYKFKA